MNENSMTNRNDIKQNASETTISVILPVYNVASWIQDCIDSLKRQRLQGLEFIFVDDCSSDDSVSIIEAFAKEDPRVVILKNTQNSGSGPSRNRGIEVAKGKYLSFIDPDDWVSDDYYEMLYQKAISDDYDIVKGRRHTFGEERPSYLNEQIISEQERGIPLCFVYTYEHQTGIFKHTLFEDPEIRYGLSSVAQDTTFLLKVCSKTEHIGFIDEAIYYYRLREGAATSQYSLKRTYGKMDAVEEKYRFLSTRPYSDNLKWYCNQQIKFIISYFYYYLEDQTVTVEEFESFKNRINEVCSKLGTHRLIFNDCYELKALLEYAFLIPAIGKDEDPTRRVGIKCWVDFFLEYPKENTKEYLNNYAEMFVRYLAFLLIIKKYSIKMLFDECVYFLKQTMRMGIWRTIYVLFLCFINGMKLVCDKFITNHSSKH